MAGFKSVFERCGDWWVASIDGLPGANTQGRTLDEARRNLEEAVQLVLAANRQLQPGCCANGAANIGATEGAAAPDGEPPEV